MQEVQRKQNAQFSQLDQTAQEQGFVIQRGQFGVFFVPLIDGKKRNVLARLTTQQTLKEMSAALNALLEKKARKSDESQQDSVSP